MSASNLIIAPILIPLVVGAALLFFEDRERRLKLVLSLLSAFSVLSVSVLLMARINLADGSLALVYLVGNWPAPIAINLVADRLSVVMLILTAILAFPALIFASERWEKAGPAFHTLFQFLLVGVNGAFLTGDLFNLFVFFEIMLAASYGLVLHGGGARIRAGLHYIAINLGVALIFLIGIAMIFGVTGSLNMADVAIRAGSLEGFAVPGLQVGFAMLGLAFLVKAGMWPLSFWLVPAYSAAPGPAAAIFAILSKVGIYALLRLALLLPGDGAAFGSILIFLGGVATLVFASLGILASQSMRRANGYFILMSSGTLLATFGISQPASTAGALFYLLSSTIAVSAFFLIVELIEREQDMASDVLAVTMEAYGDDVDDEEHEEELGQLMPGALAVLGIAFSILAIVLIGLPPFSGFLAKFAILTAMVGPGAASLDVDGTMRIVLAGLLILSGLVTMIALLRMGIRTFWAPVQAFQPKVTIMETAPILMLVGMLVALTIGAGPVMNVLTMTANELHDPAYYLDAVTGAENVTRQEGR